MSLIESELGLELVRGRVVELFGLVRPCRCGEVVLELRSMSEPEGGVSDGYVSFPRIGPLSFGRTSLDGGIVDDW